MPISTRSRTHAAVLVRLAVLAGAAPSGSPACTSRLGANIRASCGTLLAGISATRLIGSASSLAPLRTDGEINLMALQRTRKRTLELELERGNFSQRRPPWDRLQNAC